MKKKKKKKNYIAMEKITEVFELPSEILLGRSKMILSGNTDLFIENHQGILKYTKENVKIRIPDFVLCITGKELILRAMGTENVVVKGFIGDIYFEAEGRET